MQYRKGQTNVWPFAFSGPGKVDSDGRLAHGYSWWLDSSPDGVGPGWGVVEASVQAIQ